MSKFVDISACANSSVLASGPLIGGLICSCINLKESPSGASLSDSHSLRTIYMEHIVDIIPFCYYSLGL